MKASVKVKDLKLSLDQLLLDPNNYRLASGAIHEPVSDSNVLEHQPKIQEKLVKQKLADLKGSIKENGFLEIDRIVVRKLDGNNDHYLVIEGNRRTAAFKSLMADAKKGLEVVDADLIAKSKSINVVLIEGTLDQIKLYESTLMGIRHVSGPKGWSGLQAARLIHDLIEEGKTASQVGALLGISAIDANRRLRGYYAYLEMERDPNYKDRMKDSFYALFLEFLPKKESIGGEWLNWSDEKKSALNTDRRERLYSALVEREIHNPKMARDFLKAISIEHYRDLIDNYERFGDLGEINAEVEEHKKTIKKFLQFLNNSTVSSEDRDVEALLKKVIDKVNARLGGE